MKYVVCALAGPRGPQGLLHVDVNGMLARDDYVGPEAVWGGISVPEHARTVTAARKQFLAAGCPKNCIHPGTCTGVQTNRL